MKKRLIHYMIPLISFCAFIALWYIVSLAVGAELILPLPGGAARQFIALLGKGSFYRAAGGSVLRAIAGFSAALLCAFIIAMAAFRFKTFKNAVMPVISIVRGLPTISIILLAIIWFGSSLSPVLISLAVVFPTLFTAFYSALCGIDRDLLETSRLFGGGAFLNLKDIYLPLILPSGLDACRNALSLNLKLVIAGEALAQTAAGIGTAMQLSKIRLETASLFAWTIAALLICFLLEGLIAALKKLLVRW